MSLKQKIQKLLFSHFTYNLHDKYIVSMIGYGSGVFQQANSQSQQKNQIDLIISVKNSSDFHKDNFQRNRNDYTGFAKLFGAHYLSFLNQKIFPWHSNHIIIQKMELKYSVVEHNKLIQDLSKWSLLSIAGRLHKPVLHITQITPQLQLYLKKNYISALSIALLLLLKHSNKEIPHKIIYQKICTLSYMGDIRNTLKIQNPNKINNIVEGSYSLFYSIYTPILKQFSQILPQSFSNINSNSIKIVYDQKLIFFLLKNLPENVMLRLHRQLSNTNGNNIYEKVMLHGYKDCMDIIINQISKINRVSSIKMVIQNFFSSSLINNMKYLIRKISKSLHK